MMMTTGQAMLHQNSTAWKKDTANVSSLQQMRQATAAFYHLQGNRPKQQSNFQEPDYLVTFTLL